MAYDAITIPVKKVKQKGKGEMVVDEILTLIASGNLKPGDRMPPENSLAETFGVSRVTIRESFKKLSMMGAVTIRQGDGTYVNKINPSSFMKPLFPLLAYDHKNVSEIYEARSYIEGGACELAAVNRSDEDIEALHAAVTAMKEAISNNDNIAYSKYDKQFHVSIGNASKNQILLTTYTMLSDIIHGYIGLINQTPFIIADSMKYHELILNSIIGQRPVVAGIYMKEHLRISKELLVDYLKKSTSNFV